MLREGREEEEWKEEEVQGQGRKGKGGGGGGGVGGRGSGDRAGQGLPIDARARGIESESEGRHLGDITWWSAVISSESWLPASAPASIALSMAAKSPSLAASHRSSFGSAAALSLGAPP
jgi:hypothetical protein